MRPLCFLLLLAALPLSAEVVERLALVTAYTPEVEGGGAGTGLTATGVHTDDAPYGIAADWSLLPAGTWVSIPGYRDSEDKGGPWWPVDDSGGAMRASAEEGVLHLDVRMRTVWSARQWGCRWVTVRVWVPDGGAAAPAQAPAAPAAPAASDGIGSGVAAHLDPAESDGVDR
jgi:3D (Asp-Asp-Asp) domain-containing protein